MTIISLLSPKFHQVAEICTQSIHGFSSFFPLFFIHWGRVRESFKIPRPERRVSRDEHLSNLQIISPAESPQHMASPVWVLKSLRQLPPLIHRDSRSPGSLLTASHSWPHHRHLPHPTSYQTSRDGSSLWKQCSKELLRIKNTDQ